jgi:hypothetical protein
MPIPGIAFLELPKEEWPAGAILRQLCGMLESTIFELRTSLDLFHVARSHGQLAWATIGLKQGALAIANFLEVKTTIGNVLPQSPSIDAVVDKAALKRADELFKTYFPSAREFRTAVVHPGRIYRNPKEKAKNTIGGNILHFSVVDGCPEVIIGDARHRYSPDEQTIQNLEEVREEIYGALWPAVIFTRELVRQRLERGDPQPGSD